MKRTCLSILMFMLLLSFPVKAFAVSQTYSLDALGMSIDIPSEYVVFTRDIADDDPNLSAYGLSKNDMADLMESGNIYLNAWDKDVNFEIIVTMIDSTISDFNLMSDTMLNTLGTSFEDEYAKSGITVEKYEVYQHDQAKFIKIYINQPNGAETVYGLQYYTVYDNKAINVTMQSYSGKIDSSKESTLNEIVNTVHFEQDPLLPESVSGTAAFMYNDTDTGTEFLVPADWTQEPLSKDREVFDVKFTSNREPGLIILYGSTDIWAEMTTSEKKGLSRSDINNSMFTAEEFAEAMGETKSNVLTATYGGEEYYQYTTTSTNSSYGVNVDVTMTSLMRIENGYAYAFQFSGDTTNAFYKDFESLLESVKYPCVESPSLSDVSSEFSVTNIILDLLITIAIYSVPIIIYRYSIIKHPVAKAKAKKITIIYGVIAFIVMSILIVAINGNGAAGGAILLWSWINYRILVNGKPLDTEEPEVQPSIFLKEDSQTAMVASNLLEATPTSQDDPDESNVVFCYKCGTKLDKKNQFCHKCGTKIVK